MSHVRFRASSGEIATGTSAKTLVQLVAAANHRCVVQLRVSFKGTSASATPVLCELLRQSTAGTMSALTLVKELADDPETLQTTAQHTATVEPTAGDVLAARVVHPQGGSAVFRTVVPGGGRVGLRVTAGASVSAVVEIEGEE